MRLAAVILTGGGARRLGGAEKASVVLGDRTLLEHALDAVTDADEVVVVGPPADTPRRVTYAREDPPGGGPVAGLVAGYAALTRPPDLLVVTAVDMPRLTAGTVTRLVVAATGDGAFLTSGGRRHLAGVLRPRTVPWPSPEAAQGMPMHRLLAGLDLADVPAKGAEAKDVDTWEDLDQLRAADPNRLR